jgi:hypothetical protein
VLIKEGRAQTVDDHGQIIGIFDDMARPPAVELHLRPGDQLIFYTDGLFDSQSPRMSVDDFITELGSPIVEDRVIEVIDALFGIGPDADGAAPTRTDDMAAMVFTVPEAASPNPVRRMLHNLLSYSLSGR